MHWTADFFEGMTWSERAALGGLRATIDPLDIGGRKNRYIDRLQRRAVVTEIRKRMPIHRAVDFGCGTGRFFADIARYADEVWGVDRTAAMLEAAAQTGVIPASRLVLHQSDALPFRDGFFQLFVTVSVLCVMPAASRLTSLRELRRVCAENGCGILLEQGYSGERPPIDAVLADAIDAGFSVARIYPVRFGGGWRPMGFVRRYTLPDFALDGIGWIESLVAHGRKTPDQGKYLDYCIVLEPR